MLSELKVRPILLLLVRLNKIVRDYSHGPTRYRACVQLPTQDWSGEKWFKIKSGEQLWCFETINSLQSTGMWDSIHVCSIILKLCWLSMIVSNECPQWVKVELYACARQRLLALNVPAFLQLHALAATGDSKNSSKQFHHPSWKPKSSPRRTYNCNFHINKMK
jgi:hypothetical protein